MAYQGINSALLGYLMERENQVVTIDQMVVHFGDRFERRQIMSNMLNLAKSPAGSGIEKLQMGMWRYKSGADVKPETAATKQLFEFIRELSDGLLLIGEDGELYRAKRIKL